jgi:hypothetical protein
MRYIDYLKLHIKIAAWMYSAVLASYGIICYLGSIQPIFISGRSIVQAVSFIILSALGQWWTESLKNK